MDHQTSDFFASTERCDHAGAFLAHNGNSSVSYVSQWCPRCKKWLDREDGQHLRQLGITVDDYRFPVVANLTGSNSRQGRRAFLPEAWKQYVAEKKARRGPVFVLEPLPVPIPKPTTKPPSPFEVTDEVRKDWEKLNHPNTEVMESVCQQLGGEGAEEFEQSVHFFTGKLGPKEVVRLATRAGKWGRKRQPASAGWLCFCKLCWKLIRERQGKPETA
jgi:hypothetical protein